MHRRESRGVARQPNRLPDPADFDAAILEFASLTNSNCSFGGLLPSPNLARKTGFIFGVTTMPNNPQAEENAGTKTRKRRIVEALEIKASALRIIEAQGTLMRVSEIDLLHAKWKGLDIMYTPNVPDDPPELIERAQRSGIAIPPITSHLLDIWQDRKVFSIGWNDTGLVEIVRFQRGEWESLLSPRVAT
jgi:hypothetical protein